MWPRDSKAPLRTKLVATIGPATSDAAKLETLLSSGVDVCRLNFSHGELADHERVLALVRDWSARNGRPIAVLGDLCGPKIRLNRVAGGSLQLATGTPVRFVPGDAESTGETLTTTYPKLTQEVEVGQRIYIDDGLVRLLVIERKPGELLCTCTAGGTISSRKGVNLPDTHLSVPALTEKDQQDLEWALRNGLDYVALSFVRAPQDLITLNERIAALQGDVGVIVKIEKREALKHLDELIANCNGVMVARGDLGVEMDVWEVPLWQKGIVRRCREAGIPVIIATQMLQSMVASPMPTRAEVSDVANAIIDSADAVMLSAETASGVFPHQSVEIMSRVARATERYLTEIDLPSLNTPIPCADQRTAAIARAAVQAALHLNARVVAVWSATGETVRIVARHRLPMPVAGLTYAEKVWRRMGLLRGVVPILVEPISEPARMARVLDDRLVAEGLAAPGDLIVVVTSTQPTQPGQTDTTLVHRVIGH